MQKADGMNYAPTGKANIVVKPGEFVFAVIGLEHGHIYGMTNGLLEAGATLKWVYDRDPEKIKEYQKKYPQAQAAESEDQILCDPEVKLVAGAAIPCERAPLGIRVMKSGKDYFTDKTPLTSLEQLEAAKLACQETGRRYFVYFSERLHVECAVYAGKLIQEGRIGRVLQVIGMGPHRLGPPDKRPDWFYQREKYGGILCDIGSHQIEQYLFFSGATDAKIVSSQIANHQHPDHPELDDFGDAMLAGNNGTSNYFRVDWFTPDGLSSWGDGRTFILGTDGYIELRKYLNVGVSPEGDNLFLVDHKGEQFIPTRGTVGFPFFGEMILDCINRTDKAMTQAHIFKAAELCVRAQMAAKRLEPWEVPADK